VDTRDLSSFIATITHLISYLEIPLIYHWYCLYTLNFRQLSRTPTKHGQVELWTNEVLSLEEDEPIKSLEETSEVQSDSSGQDHDKFRKVGGVFRKMRGENQALLMSKQNQNFQRKPKLKLNLQKCQTS
jgi:hypothetical protein